MEEKRFSWKYVEKCPNEFESLIAKRKSKELNEAINHATQQDLDKCKDSLIEYVLLHPYDYFGIFLLARILETTTPIHKPIQKRLLTSLSLQPYHNLNAKLQLGLSHIQQNNFTSALFYLLKAQEECFSDGKSSEQLLEEILAIPVNLESKSDTDLSSFPVLGEQLTSDEISMQTINSLLEQATTKSRCNNSDIKCKKLLYAIAFSLISIGKTEQSISYIKQCVEIFPKKFKYRACYTFANRIGYRRQLIQKLREFRDSALLKDVEHVFYDKSLPVSVQEFITCLLRNPGHTGKCTGFCHFFAGMQGKRLEFFQDAISKNPNNRLFQLTMCQSFQSEQSVIILKDILRQASQNPQESESEYLTIDCLSILGEIAIQDKRYIEGFDYYSQIIKLDSFWINWKDLLILAQQAYEQNEFTSMLTFAKAAQKFTHSNEKQQEQHQQQISKSTFQQMQYFAAFALCRLKRFNEALFELEKVKNSSMKKIIYLLGEVNLELKNYEVAEGLIKQCSEIDSLPNIHTLYLLGLIDIALRQDTVSAEIKFKQSIMRNANFTPSYFELAKIQFENGNIIDSTQNLQYALSRNDASEQTFQLMAQIHTKSNNREELKKLYELWVVKFPSSSVSVTYAKYLQFDERDFEKAIEYYQNYLKNFNEIDRENINYQLGVCYLNVGLYSDAICSFLQVSYSNPEKYECYFKLSSIYADLGEFELARKYVEKGLEFNATHAMGLTDFALILLYHDKKPKEAIRILKKSLLVDESSVKTLFLLGMAYAKQKKYKNSMLHFRNVLQRKPGFENAQLMAGFVSFKLGEIKHGRQILSSIKIPPIKVQKYFYCLAKGYAAEKQRQESIESFEYCALQGFSNSSRDNKIYFSEAIEETLENTCDPSKVTFWIDIITRTATIHAKLDHPLVHKLLGIAYLSIRNSFKKARTHLSASLLANPGSEFCKLRLLRCAYELKEESTENILKQLEEFSNEFRQNIEYQMLQVELISATKNYAAANKISQQWALAYVRPRLVDDARYLMGRQLILVKDAKKGLKIHQINPKHAPSLRFLAEYKLKSGDGNGAIQEAQKAYNCDTNYTPGIRFLAEQYQTRGDFTQALTYFLQYIEKSEIFCVEVRMGLVQCNINQNNFKEALKYAKEIFEFDASSIEAHLSIGHCYTILERYSEGKDILIAGSELAKHKNASILYYLSICQENLGSLEDAKASLLSCVANKELPEYLSKLGGLYMKIGDLKLAKINFKRCLKLEPTNYTALIRLTEYYANANNKESNIEKAFEFISTVISNHAEKLEGIRLYFSVLLQSRRVDKIPSSYTRFKAVFDKNPSFRLEILEKLFENLHIFDPLMTKEYFATFAEIESKKKSEIPIQCMLRVSQLNFILRLFAAAEKQINGILTYIKISKQKMKENQFAQYYFMLAQLMLQYEDQDKSRFNFNTVKMYLMKSIEFSNRTLEQKYSKDTKIAAQIALVRLFKEHYHAKVKGNVLLEQLRKLNLKTEGMLILEATFLLDSYRKQLSSSKGDSENNQSLLLQAQQLLKECCNLYPNSALALFHLGESYLGQESQYPLDLAKQVFVQCILKNKLHSDSIYSKPLTSIQCLKAQYGLAILQDQSKQAHDFVLELSLMNHIESILNHVEYLFEYGGEYSQILVFAKRALARNRTNPRLHYIIGKTTPIPEQAVISFQRCKTYDPAFPNIDLLLAEALELNADPIGALQIYLSLLSFHDASTHIFEQCVRILTSLQQYERAQILFERYIQVHKVLSANLYIAQSYLYRRQGLAEKSIETLKESLESYPNHVQTVISFADCLFEKRDYDGMLDILIPFMEQAEFTNSTNTKEKAKIFNHFSNALTQLGLFDDALSYYVKAIEEDPDTIGIQFNIGLCMLAQNRYEEACNKFTNILEQSKSGIIPCFYLGVTHSLMKQEGSAMKFFRRCLLSNPLFAPAAMNLSILQRKAGNFKEAINILYPFHVTSDPIASKLINPLYHLALSYYQEGEYKEALIVLQKLLANYESYLLVSQSVKGDRHISWAIDRVFTQFTRKNTDGSHLSIPPAISYQQMKLAMPTEEIIRLLLARVLRKLNRIDDGKRVLDEFVLSSEKSNVLISPTFMFAHAMLADESKGKELQGNTAVASRQSLLQRGEKKDIYKKCIELDPLKKSVYLLGVANELHRSGEVDEEVNVLLESIELNPMFAPAYRNLGVAYTKGKKFEKALLAFEKAIELTKDNSQHTDDVFNIANTLMALRQIDLAILSYMKVISIDPNHLQAQFNLGIAQGITQNFKQAKRCFEICKQINPRNADQYQAKIDHFNHRERSSHY